MCLIASDRRLPLGIYQGHWRPLHCLLTTITVHGRGRAYRSAAEASSLSCLCTPVFPLRLSYLLHRPQQFVPIRSLSFQIRRVKTARLEWTQPAFVWTSFALLAAWTFEPSKPRCSPPAVSLPADIIHTSAAFASHRPFSGLLLGRGKTAQ